MKIFLCTLLCFFMVRAHTQKREYTDPPIWGFNIGMSTGRYVNVEAGYGISCFLSTQKSLTDDDYKVYLLAADLSAEWLPGKKLWGPKFSCRFLNLNDGNSALGFIVGGEFILYNNFKNAVSVVRPTAGIQFLAGTLELSYGYNFAKNNDFHLPLNTHLIQFRIKPVIIYELLSRAWG